MKRMLFLAVMIGITANANAQYVNQPPIVRLRVTPQLGTAPLTVVGDVSKSVDPDGNISKAVVYWDFDGDGNYDRTTQGIEDKPKYTYYSPGMYTVVVMIKDENNASSTKTLQVRVESKESQTSSSTLSAQSNPEGTVLNTGGSVSGFKYDSGDTKLGITFDIGCEWRQGDSDYRHNVCGFATMVLINENAQAYNYGAAYTGNLWLGKFEKRYVPFFLFGLIGHTVTASVGGESETKTYTGFKAGAGIRYFHSTASSIGFKFGIFDNIIDVGNGSSTTHNIEISLGMEFRL